MKIILGIVLGIVIYHYFPGELQGLAEQAGSYIHQGASYVADNTK